MRRGRLSSTTPSVFPLLTTATFQAEKERHDALDHIVLLARRDELHRAPLVPSGEDYPQLRILDVGCGTGIWAINMAEYVRASVVSGSILIIRLTYLHPAVNILWRRYNLDSILP